MTVRSVAEQAGVSPETIYKGLRRQARADEGAVDVTLAGDDLPVAIATARKCGGTVRQEPAEKLAPVGRVRQYRNQRLAPLYGCSPRPARGHPGCSLRPSGNGWPASARFVTHLADSGLLAAG